MLENKQQIINILWKEHLINDSQQFHQYPHTNNYIYLSTQIIEYKNTMTYDVGDMG